MAIKTIKGRRSALAPKAKTRAKVVDTSPKPMAGTTNRFDHNSVSPQEAIEMASLSQGLELDFGHDEKAMRKYRSRLYSINKEFSGKWRFRTIREDTILMIWRLAY